VWGFSDFRPLQREAMHAVLQSRDSVVVLPTGGGKSLCFQAPAIVDADDPWIADCGLRIADSIADRGLRIADSIADSIEDSIDDFRIRSADSIDDSDSAIANPQSNPQFAIRNLQSTAAAASPSSYRRSSR
jgi:hypothetical protein